MKSQLTNKAIDLNVSDSVWKGTIFVLKVQIAFSFLPAQGARKEFPIPIDGKWLQCQAKIQSKTSFCHLRFL